jgi:cell division protein FtsI (penicillin-binding protein 3)
MAARTIGKDRRVGIEGYYDSILSGVEGIRLEQFIAGGYWKPEPSEFEVEPKQGYDIVSTIDINIQDVAHNALLSTLKKHNARHGAAVLMEVSTGEILAMSNLKRLPDGSYTEDNKNFAVGERTVPGSTIKLASLMIAMEDGYIDINDVYDTGDGTMMLYDKEIKDSKGFGKLTVKQIFELSSNVGVVTIIEKFYGKRPKQFIDRLYKLHLNQPTGIDIEGELKPVIRSPEDDKHKDKKVWSGISLAQMSYGYEMQLTPLQILTLYNAVANNGVMVRPKVVKGISSRGIIIKTFPTEIIDARIASPGVIRKMQEMLEGVVENGTAKNLSKNAYKIAGKTGTAQLEDKDKGYTNVTGYLASFVGYFPAKDPKYSCIVIVNEPSNNQYYGNAVAGPVFKEIADKVFATRPDMISPLNERIVPDNECIPISLSGYKPDLTALSKIFKIAVQDESHINHNWVVTSKLDNAIRMQNKIFPEKQIPNVVGMGARDAVALCENAGLKVEITGRGTVVKQSMQPFVTVRDGDKIVLSLSNN